MAYDMFLQIEGINGDSSDAGHKQWIEVQSYTHGIAQATGGAASAQGALTGGRADHQDFTITKLLDSATPNLALYCCKGTPITSIKLELCRAMGDKTTFMVYTLTDCVVSSVVPSGVSASEDLLPLEEVGFRYGAIQWAYTPTDPTGGGSTGGTIQQGWSTLENQPI